MRQRDPQQLVQTALSKVKREDIAHRGFLKPIEIALKTSTTERDQKNSLKPGSLPAGLKITFKDEQNRRNLRNIEEVDSQNWEDLKMNNQNNMLSLIKQREGIELAICVCMYSEDKKMLKSTLAGIAENISNIVAQQKVNPDKIGVFVMMDGIEKVDPSIVDYFEELERSSGIFLGENTLRSESYQEMIQRYSSMTNDEINDEEMKNINNFLFDVEELKEREQLRFQVVWQTYHETKKTMEEVKDLLKKHPLYEDLPAKLQPYFLKEAREERKKDYVQTDDVVKALVSDVIIDEYAKNVSIARPIMQRALKNAQKQCKAYITERQDLAYLGSFRRKTRYDFCKLGNKAQTSLLEETRQIMHEEESEEGTFMNLFLCVKYKNSGKLSSHNWFFNGFCKELRPKYAVLLDVGLRPDGEALLKMYNYLEKHKVVGGVCGYMSLKIEKTEESEEVKDQDVDFLTSIAMRFVDIQRTQQVEYHFAHLMDKPFEAAFGFIHVLPGAFSAYNMNAIFNYNSSDDDQLLREYFKSIDEKMKNRKVIESQIGVKNAILSVALPETLTRCCIDIDPESDEAMLYNENVYLAEDRILCMGIHKRGFDMAYLPDAYAEVDPMKTIHSLLGQRKRWINGSFFAFEKVKKELSEHEKEKGCECFLRLQIFYLSFMNSLSYFAPAFFLFTVHIAMEAFRQGVLVPFFQGEGIADVSSSKILRAFVYTIDFIYVMLIMTLVFYSLHFKNNNKHFMPYIYGISTLFGLFMIAVFFVLAIDIFNGFFYGDAFLVGNPENAALVDSLPGGILIVDAMRWMLVGSILIYILPISLFIFLFRKLNILCEIILGSLSFLFYGPTYLIILNIYSLCRIDDISWGTKGLDNTSTKNANLMGSWKLIKVLHVSKFVIWNVILSVVLLSLGSDYKLRFFVTLVMVILIGLSMSIKVVVGSAYLLKYWCGNLCVNEKIPDLTIKSRIDSIIDSYQRQIRAEVEGNLNNIKNEYISSNRSGTSHSFIMASRSKSSIKKAEQKMKNSSKVMKTTAKRNIGRSFGLATIPQEPPSKKKLPPIQVNKKQGRESPYKEMESSFRSDQALNPNSPEKISPPLPGRLEVESKEQVPNRQRVVKPSQESLGGGFNVRDKSKDKEMKDKFKMNKKG